MQRTFDTITQDSEKEIGEPCSRRDCRRQGAWEIKINDRIGVYFLCDAHFQEYEEVYRTRLSDVQNQLVAYMNKIGATPYPRPI